MSKIVLSKIRAPGIFFLELSVFIFLVFSQTLSFSAEHASSVNVDVMIVYTPAARQWADDNSSGIDNVIAHAIERTREALDNSDTLVDVRLVHAAEVNYSESRFSGAQHLRHLTNSDDGYMEDVHVWRDRYGADIVQLLTKTSYYGGLAWQLVDPEGSPEYGFFLVRVQQAEWTYTMAHEFGHNFGCHHNVEDTDHEGLFAYSYGWRWLGPDDERYCTVMAYDDNGLFRRVPHFSNPDVSYNGALTGGAGADNARTIRELRHAVSRYRLSGLAKIVIGPEDVLSKGAAWSPDGGENWYETGEELRLAAGAHEIIFQEVSGWQEPEPVEINVIAESLVTHTAGYLALGNLEVILQPLEASQEGAAWSPDGGENWYESGQVLAVLTGVREIVFKEISDWQAPESVEVLLTSESFVSHSAEYVPAGVLNVIIEPQDARSAGAEWSPDGGENWYGSGEELILPEGDYRIIFRDLEGLHAPQETSVELVRNTEVELFADYYENSWLDVQMQTPKRENASAETLVKILIEEIGEKTLDIDSVSIRLDTDSGGGTVYKGKDECSQGRYRSNFGETYRVSLEGSHAFYFIPEESFVPNQQVMLEVTASDTGITPVFTEDLVFQVGNRLFGPKIKLSDAINPGSHQVIAGSDGKGGGHVLWDQLLETDNTVRDIFWVCYPVPFENESNENREPEALGQKLFGDSIDRKKPALAMGGEGNVYLVWERETNEGRSIEGALYDPRADEWQVWDLPEECLENDVDVHSPEVAVTAEGYVYLSWLRFEGDETSSIHIARMNSSRGWDSPEELIGFHVVSEEYSLAAGEGNAYVVWSGHADAETGLFLAGSMNDWNPYRILDARVSESQFPDISVGNESVHVVWVGSEDSGAENISYASFPFDLQAMETEVFRVDDDTSGGEKSHPSIAVLPQGATPDSYSQDAAKVMVAWQDGGEPVSEGMSYINYAENGYPHFELFGESQLIGGSEPAMRVNPQVVYNSAGRPYIVWITDGRVYYSGSLDYGDVVSSGASALDIDNRPVVEKMGDIIVEFREDDMVHAPQVKVMKVENAPGTEQIPGWFGVIYDFQPTGLQFSQPAVMTIPYRCEESREGSKFSVYWYDSREGIWKNEGVKNIEHLELPHNEDICALRFEVMHFTLFALSGYDETHDDENDENDEGENADDEEVEEVEEKDDENYYEDEDEDDKEKTGCFIATAAFGSQQSPMVRILRRFRDEKMTSHATGRRMVSIYYRHSPPIAAAISGSPLLRFFAWLLLLPVCLAAYASMSGHFSFMVIFILFFLLYLKKRSS